LADEKALKEVFDIKGQAGNLPCTSCLNIRNRWCDTDAEPTAQKFWDPNLEGRIEKTHGHHMAAVARLIGASTIAQRTSIQTKTGVNFNPSGILFSAYLMASIVSMPAAYIRDWMHTLVSNGVAGSHLSAICSALESIGIGIEIVQAYCMKFKLPMHRGSKPSNLYFQDHLVDTDNVRHFAGDVLGMLVIMYAFLKDKIQPRGLLPEHIACFESLYKMICSLRHAEIDIRFEIRFESEVVKHAKAFIRLYGVSLCKVKFHHLYHLAKDMARVGKCVSCFPGERRNKDAISVANASDRSLENTAVRNFLHKSVLYWEENGHAALPRHMFSPSDMIFSDGRTFRKSTHIVAECGHIHANDMVYLKNGNICNVIEFWEIDDEIFCKALMHDHVHSLYFAIDAYISFVSLDAVVEPIFWYENVQKGCIVAAVPEFV
jgi:hypothetical protein